MTRDNERQPNVVILRASLDDRESIDGIRTRSIRGLAASHHTSEQIAAWRANKALEKYPVETEYMVVALVDGTIAGFGELHLKTQEVRAIYVDEKYARQGVGSAILHDLENTAQENGRY